MKIYQLIPKIMSEVGAIEKNRKNQTQGYTFRGIDDVYLAFQHLLAKYGVFFVPSVTDSKREEKQSKTGGVINYTILTVKYTFYADDGSNFECLTVGEAMDSGDKSTNKAMSAALKYALLQIFCIPTEEEKDTEYQSPEVKPFTVRQPEPTARRDFPVPPIVVKPPRGTVYTPPNDDVPHGWNDAPPSFAQQLFNPTPPVTEDPKTRITRLAKESKWTNAQVKSEIKRFGYESLADMTPSHVEELALHIKGNPIK